MVLAVGLLCYLAGSVPYALLVPLLLGLEGDVREAGSGNPGATNVARVHGARVAAVVLAADLAKGLLAVLLARAACPEAAWAEGLALLAAFLGHCFPVFLSFRGGKGVATAAGGLLILAPGPTLAALVAWAATLALSGRSSLASLAGALTCALALQSLAPDAVPVGLALVAGIAARHLGNVQRLVRGEERRVVEGGRLTRAKEAGDPRQEAPGGGALVSRRQAWLSSASRSSDPAVGPRA